MLYFVIFWFCLCGLFLLWHFATKKYLNPYKLCFCFGKKGCGKSSLLTKLALHYIKKGWNVFTTERIPGTFYFTYSDVGRYKFPPHSVLLIDEASLAWDNRNFKSMPPQVIEWFRYQRHERVKVYLFSQTFDVDSKIRGLADEMFLLQKKMRVFTYGKRVLRIDDIVEATGQAESRVVQQLRFDSLLFFWCGSRSLTFIPRYTSLFNSFSESPTQWLPKEFEYVPLLRSDVRSPRLLRSLNKHFDEEEKEEKFSSKQ